MPTFHHSPDLHVLQRLGHFSPADKDQGNNLRKAIRIWYYLKELDFHFASNNNQFTDQEWRNHLYINPVRNRDKLPEQHPNCISSKVIPHILFGDDRQPAIRWQDWKRQFTLFYRSSFPQSVVEDYLQTIESIYPFNVTGKTIFNDLEHLSAVGYLQKIDTNTFQVADNPPKIEPMAQIAIKPRESEESIFLAEDFDSYQHCFAEPLNGIQRFYIHGEYRSVDGYTSGNVQKQLKRVWEESMRVPLALTYHSASQGCTYQEIVYPLLIHYYQRAFYLCAYGQTKANWHNYRIDRIEKICSLDWTDSLVGKDLALKFATGDVHEQISEVQEAWEAAYGCDFYQPDQVMLLRFERNFHDRYIKKTFRHHTFQRVPYHKVQRFLQEHHLQEPALSIALERIQTHPEDAYYQMNYRTQDHSVLMRLRAWSPNVEVLSPVELRERMAKDIDQAAGFY